MLRYTFATMCERVADAGDVLRDLGPEQSAIWGDAMRRKPGRRH